MVTSAVVTSVAAIPCIHFQARSRTLGCTYGGILKCAPIAVLKLHPFLSLSSSCLRACWCVPNGRRRLIVEHAEQEDGELA